CILIYYGANYLPDVPALCFALIGFYFFVRHSFDFKNSDFVLAIFFSTLASLLKISSALIFVCIILYTFYQKFILKNQNYNRANIFVIFSGLLAIASWIIYVKIYNEMGQYFGNLQGTMGIWLCDTNQIL